MKIKTGENDLKRIVEASDCFILQKIGFLLARAVADERCLFQPRIWTKSVVNELSIQYSFGLLQLQLEFSTKPLKG